MTFYWWSHWFWITYLSVHLLPNAITHVHTYPSQEVSLESTLHQLAGQEPAAEAGQRQQTTKLYQTTASQTWATSSTQRNVMDLTHKTTAVPTVVTAASSYMSEDAGPQAAHADDVESPITDADLDENDNVNDDDDDDDVEGDSVTADKQGVAESEPTEGESDEHEHEPDGHGHEANEAKLALSHNQFEFKRSADFATVPGDKEQLNNYTNFSRITSTNHNANENVTISSSRSGGGGGGGGDGGDNPLVRSSTVAIPTSLPTATAESTSTSTSTSTSSPPSNSLGHTVTAATPSTPKINTEWLSDEKAPFTLENANKEDELRRAETEHRSRKSKVLSAEYKHINRYINFSSDTKSLLTRSAASTPSVSGYNSDEGNISSEALAIQRTYFLDAGAISAICFTVFGICCTVGTIGIVLYRRRYVNKPQALSEPDSSIYIDDSTMRDNSDEMYSLDNDSFLNSLEAMTIQNYWTDTVKHTKL